MSEEWSLNSEYLSYLAGLAEVSIDKYRDFMRTRRMTLLTIGESPQTEEYYFIWPIDEYTVIIDHLYKYECELIETDIKFANAAHRLWHHYVNRRSDYPHKCKIRNILNTDYKIQAPLWGIEREGDQVSYFVIEKPTDDELLFMNPFTYDGFTDPKYISRERFFDTLRKKRAPMIKARLAEINKPKRQRRTTAPKKEGTDPT